MGWEPITALLLDQLSITATVQLKKTTKKFMHG
jgi:hypothetical protein